MTATDSASTLEVRYRGGRAIVRKNDGHPEEHLWIDVDGRTFFLGILEKGMTRGDVKRMALAWLEARRG